MNDYGMQSREWWAQQWIDLLETSRFKKRLERARIYAREGNVLSIEFQGSLVLAKVQGTEAEPYKVKISLECFSDEAWANIIETLSQKAIFTAKLLAGEMPQNIQKVFSDSGVSLYPFTLSEIRSQCSCPDKQVPCKHIGAVYYLLGDRFSEDPFGLFQLRGRTKEQILEGLRQLRRGNSLPTVIANDNPHTVIANDTLPTVIANDSEAIAAATANDNPHPVIANDSEAIAAATANDNPHPVIANDSEAIAAATAQTLQPKRQPTPLKVEGFWEYNSPLDSTLVAPAAAVSSETVLNVLGAIPLADANAVMQYLDSVYHAVSQQAAR